VSAAVAPMQAALASWSFLRPEAWAGSMPAWIRVLLIVLVALLARAVTTRLIRTFRQRLTARMADDTQVRRAETLGRALRYAASVVILVLAGMLVLGELGVSMAPLLGAAGVVGIAIGFGAQSLVKDYFNGFFLLLENQLARGDVVELGGKAGQVEDLTLRYVKLRDYDGNVHFVPNGLVGTVTNMSHEFAYAVIDVGIAYREDVDMALAVMRKACESLRQDPAFAGRILAPFEVAGLDRLADSAVIVRGRFKVGPLQQWDVRRECLRRIKQHFDAAGIEIPFPHLTVYAGAARTGTAPPFIVRSHPAAGA
jgi:moderate conductance mechanosensitive channel